jgi:hypothetical protein
VNGASSLEGVTPTLTYYSGSKATGTPLAAAPTAVGTYTAVATFAGSKDYAAATSSPVTFSIAPSAPKLTVSCAGGTYNGAAFAASAKVNGTASLEGVSPILIYYAGSNATGTPLTGAPVAAGTYTVIARFAGSADYTSAVSGPVTFCIAKAVAVLHVTDLGGVYNGKPYAATGIVAGVGGISIATPVFTYYAKSDTKELHPLSSAPSAAGQYFVVATFAGNSNYLPSTTTVSFTITTAANGH